MEGQTIAWALFGLVVLILLALDLGALDRRPAVLTLKQALVRSAIWVAAAAAFACGIYLWHGPVPAVEFSAGYLVELSLSVDNLFVFLVIFGYFGVPKAYQHKALFWGIIGALVLRGLFIVAGVALLESFHWISYIFGAFLVFTGIKMAFRGDDDVKPERNIALRLFNRFARVTREYEKDRFFVRRDHLLWATPLFVTLLVIESSDVVFAVDSIPAVLAVTRDPFIVYTSNIFAILGLRSMYFALSGLMPLFHHLSYGLSFVLAFIGAKMLLADIFPIPTWAALLVVAAALGISIAASLLWPPKKVKSEEVKR